MVGIIRIIGDDDHSAEGPSGDCGPWSTSEPQVGFTYLPLWFRLRWRLYRYHSGKGRAATVFTMLLTLSCADDSASTSVKGDLVVSPLTPLLVSTLPWPLCALQPIIMIFLARARCVLCATLVVFHSYFSINACNP